MNWYNVVKTINGRRYHYRQKTWRERGKVMCRSEYIGPVDQVQLRDVDTISDGYDPTDPSEIAIIQQMAVDLRKGAKFPPITLDEDGTVVDGLHRLEAHRLAGFREIGVETKRPAPIPKELEGLAEEASRYDTSDEFYQEGILNRGASNYSFRNLGVQWTDYGTLTSDAFKKFTGDESFRTFYERVKAIRKKPPRNGAAK